jgi:protein ImuB
MHGDVAAASGPWRSSGEWWSGLPWMREEWDVAVGNALLRIYRNFPTSPGGPDAQEDSGSRWYAEGIYD